MKRKPAAIVLIVLILSVTATVAFYLYNSQREQSGRHLTLSGEGCRSDNVPEVVTYSSSNGQSSYGQIDAVLRKHGGDITQNYGLSGFAKVKAGDEDRVVAELSKLDGVTAERSRYKCLQ